MNQVELQRLLNDRQHFFLPYYVEIVAQHPEGIRSTGVRDRAGVLVQQRHGFDPFDGSLVGFNPTGAVRSRQWANNLISNQVLHDTMIVVNESAGIRRLYPLVHHETALPDPTSQNWPQIPADIMRAAGDREPARRQSAPGSPFVRSAALAEYVRQAHKLTCLRGAEACSVFVGRSGLPYVEVHHLYPLSAQDSTTYNLDRFENMVALCVACHARLNRGAGSVVLETLSGVLAEYEALRGVAFETAMSSSGLDCSQESLVALYLPPSMNNQTSGTTSA